MTDRVQSASTVGPHSPKMENDLSPRKTMLVLVIVVGCFAVLWPKVFYPMLVGSANQHIKPNPIDKTSGCCDVISETDVNTIKIMSELCGTIIKVSEDKPLSGKEIVQRCRQEVLETCGIDISAVLQEQVRLGQSVKQILDEIRSLNGSLCLKYNYGVAPWRLGVPHRITVKTATDAPNIRQERPLHLRSELIHPAFRERGRAIPQPQAAPPVRPPPRVVEGRPGPIPGMRPTLGGAGHVVPPSKQGTSSMSVIMPIYTIGIVIFFTYTLMKILFKKQPQSVGGSLYPPVDPDPHFRKEVFESESSRIGPRLKGDIASKLVVNAMSALLDEVDQEMEARRKSSEVASQDLVNGTLSNGDAVKPQDEEQPTVKVLGMEMTASCEGGKKWSRPESPVLTPSPPPPPAEPVPPPQEIYLEGALPAQSHLLVADSAIEPEPTSGEDPAVVLSGKMTLSVISLDSENGIEEATNGTTDKITDVQESTEPSKQFEEPPPAINEDAQEIETQIEEAIEENLQSSGLEKDIEDFLANLRAQQFEVSAPVIRLESEDVPHTVEVETVEKEVDELIQEAIEAIQHREIPTPSEQTNEINDNSASLEVTEQEIMKTPASSQFVANLQVLNDIIDEEKSPKLELRRELSDEIEKLIQEVKELPVIEQKKEILQVPKDTEESKTSVVVEPELVQVEEPSVEVSIKAETPDLENQVEEIKISEKGEKDAVQQKTEVVEEVSTKEVASNVTTQPKEEPNLEVVVAETEVIKETEKNNISIEETKDESQDVPTKAESPVLEVSTKEVASDVTTQPKEEPNLEVVVAETDAIKETEENNISVEETKDETQDVPTKAESPVPPSEKTEEIIKDVIEEINVISKEPELAAETVEKVQTEASEKQSNKVEDNRSKTSESNDEELASDEELVEEIEEIVYEEESGEEEEIEIEEIEVEEEESEEEEIPDGRNTNRTESSSVQRVNGERSEDLVEESKYTTVSGATAAENDISDEDLIDDEEVEEEEEIIEIEEEVEEEEDVNDEGNDLNHISGESDVEL